MASLPPASPPSTAELPLPPPAATPEADTILPPTPDPTVTPPVSSLSPPLSPIPVPSHPVPPPSIPINTPPVTAPQPSPAEAEHPPPLPISPPLPTIPSVPPTPPVDTAPPPATGPAPETTAASSSPPMHSPPPPPSTTSRPENSSPPPIHAASAPKNSTAPPSLPSQQLPGSPVEAPPRTLPPTSLPKPKKIPSAIPSPAETLPQPPPLSSTSQPINSTWKPVGQGKSPVVPEVAPGPINRGTLGIGGVGGGRSAGHHVSSGIAIGVAVAGVLLVLGLVLLCICWVGNRKDRKEEEDKNSTKKTDSSVNQDAFHAVPHATSTNINRNVSEKGDLVIAIPSHPVALDLLNSRSQKNGEFSPWTPGPPLSSSCEGSFSYDELMKATKAFSEANLLGEGGFGYVHKGILPNGTEIAVKQLKTGSHQGEREFQAELDIISRVHHKHLVTLLGYCTNGAARFLVYEFVPNNTLEFHLHGEGQPVMDWATRMKIAIGSAKGLAYLHEDCCPSIIHRDIKAANILLDFNFQAKVSDFGLAKLFSDTNNPITHVSTRVVGTFGYLAPEYASSGRLSEKSDIYSYGVMLLELITGRPPIKRVDGSVNEALVDWARPLLRQAIETGNADALIDPRLLNSYNPSEMESMISCATASTRRAAWLRPRMSQVAHALERKAPLIDQYGGESKLYNSLEKKRLGMALASPEHCTSRKSNTTSEYGLNPSTSSSEA